MTQATLFDAPQPEPQLTERQQFALELVQNAGRDGLGADDVGAQLCARRGKHPADELCEWCGVSGREVLRALRTKGKVKSRRGGSWYALEGVVEPEPEQRPGHGIPF